MSPWEMAPRTPISMVRAATTRSRSRCWSGNSRVWVRIMQYTPTLVSNPANTALTGLGAVG